MEYNSDNYRKQNGPFDIHLESNNNELTYPFYPKIYIKDTIHFSYKINKKEKRIYSIELDNMFDDTISLYIISNNKPVYYTIHINEELQIDEYIFFQPTKIITNNIEQYKNHIYAKIKSNTNRKYK